MKPNDRINDVPAKKKRQMGNNYHVRRGNRLEAASTLENESEDEAARDVEVAALEESEQEEPDRIRLSDKLMMGCAILTLVAPIVLLVLELVLLSLAQQP